MHSDASGLSADGPYARRISAGWELSGGGYCSEGGPLLERVRTSRHPGRCELVEGFDSHASFRFLSRMLESRLKNLSSLMRPLLPGALAWPIAASSVALSRPRGTDDAHKRHVSINTQSQLGLSRVQCLPST